LMFFSGVLFPIFIAISALAEEGGPMIVPVILFFVALVMMLYARLFSEKTAPNLTSVQIPSIGSNPTRGALPAANPLFSTGVGRNQVRTNELAQPPSVTDHTTRLLDND